jgi:hypothetical protein
MDMEHQSKQIFGCESGSLPSRHLGVLFIIENRNSAWDPVESPFFAYLGRWQSKLLSYGDHLIFIN